jgi:hypothetical protein
MQINDKVYRGYGDSIKPGIIVAKKWILNPLPIRQYIVKDIDKVESVVGILTAAFYGSKDDLHRCDSSDLIIMPTVHEEATE